MRQMMGLPAGREMVSRLGKRYEKERPACMQMIRRLGWPGARNAIRVHHQFSGGSSVDIGIFAGCRDREKMASVVRRRSSLCLPNLLELDLLRERCA